MPAPTAADPAGGPDNGESDEGVTLAVDTFRAWRSSGAPRLRTSSTEVEPRPGGQASAVFVFAAVIGLARTYWSRKSYRAPETARPAEAGGALHAGVDLARDQVARVIPISPRGTMRSCGASQDSRFRSTLTADGMSM
jgi:hypothetical protein